jgi:hypothetical protein
MVARRGCRGASWHGTFDAAVRGQVLGASGSTLLPMGCTLLPALTMMGTAEGRRYGRLGLGPVQEARVLVGSVRVLQLVLVT